MIAEWPKDSDFIRVFNDGGSYAAGSPILFAVGARLHSEDNSVHLEIGIGTMTAAYWEAIRSVLKQRGIASATWERVKDGRVLKTRMTVGKFTF